MADHIRKQIRDATKTALGALSGSAGEVFAYRVWPIEPASLPLVSVQTAGDEVSRASPEAEAHDPEAIERVVDLRVTAYQAGGEETLDGLLDATSADVERALAAGIVVSGVELRLDYQGAAVAYEGGDQPYGSVQMRWFVEVVQQADAPDGLIA